MDGDITRVVGDAAYDTVAVYDAASARGAEVVVPSARTSVVSRRRPSFHTAHSCTSLVLGDSGGYSEGWASEHSLSAASFPVLRSLASAERTGSESSSDLARRHGAYAIA